MHVHGFVYEFSDFAGPLFVANGVTGVRDMGYYVDTTLRWRADIAAGREVGPRIIVGARVDGAVNKVGYIAHVTTQEDGVRAVDTMARKKDGARRADFIKVYSYIPKDAYYGIVREAKRLGVPFAGHVPYSVTMIEAADSGQRSVEHEDDLMRACSSRDSVLRARAADTTTFSRQVEEIREQARLLATSYDHQRCRRVIAALVRNRTWFTPTLIVYKPYNHAFDSSDTHPELSRYVPGIVQGGWMRRVRALSPKDSLTVRNFYSFARTNELHKVGVRMLAGSDTPQPFVYPGFSLHDELALLVEAGLTPLEALRTATHNPAEFLGALDSLGTVATGKVADLVLLDANPLTDIRNTRRISAVIANGRLFDRAALNRLLAKVQAAVRPAPAETSP